MASAEARHSSRVTNTTDGFAHAPLVRREADEFHPKDSVARKLKTSVHRSSALNTSWNGSPGVLKRKLARRENTHTKIDVPGRVKKAIQRSSSLSSSKNASRQASKRASLAQTRKAYIPRNCGEVKFADPSAADGFYDLLPDVSDVNELASEDVATPADGVSTYCRFEGNHAWALVGTFKDGAASAVTTWDYGPYDFSDSPQPDETSSGTTYRFPFSFWNDLAQGMPDGAITITSSIYSSQDATYSHCPGFWKTGCQIYSGQQALTKECAEPYASYNEGTFDDKQFERSSGDGYTLGCGSIQGYSEAGTALGTVALTLTGFQGGAPALGKCNAGTDTYVNYLHYVGFMFWIGGVAPDPPPTPAPPTEAPTEDVKAQSDEGTADGLRQLSFGVAALTVLMLFA